MKYQQQFKDKYGYDPIKLVEDANLQYFGLMKVLGGLNGILDNYLKEQQGKENMVNNQFMIDLVEAFVEAGEKFPENGKAFIDRENGYEVQIQPYNPNPPKSKGLIEDLKDIVGHDELWPNFMCVYVAGNGFIYATDAHKLIKYKTNELDKYEGKLIKVDTYIKSGGKKIEFFDAKYPDVESVIPKEGQEKIKDLSVYAMYNFAKSCEATGKYFSRDTILNAHFKMPNGIVIGFSPAILLEVFAYAMAKGHTTFTWEYSQANRASLFVFNKDSLALQMPVMVKEDKSNRYGTPEYTVAEVMDKFSGSWSPEKASKPAKAAKAAKPSAGDEDIEPHKKYTGDFSDATYIPRRNIAYVMLRNGEKLSANEIVDGVYRVKKFSIGGQVSGKLEAPNGYVFVKVSSHRASDKIKRAAVKYISIYSFGGPHKQSASSEILMMKEKDYNKIKSIVGVAGIKSLPAQHTYFSRREEAKLHQVLESIK